MISNGGEMATGVAVTYQWHFRVSSPASKAKVYRFIFAAKEDTRPLRRGRRRDPRKFSRGKASDFAQIQRCPRRDHGESGRYPDASRADAESDAGTVSSTSSTTSTGRSGGGGREDKVVVLN